MYNRPVVKMSQQKLYVIYEGVNDDIPSAKGPPAGTRSHFTGRRGYCPGVCRSSDGANRGEVRQHALAHRADDAGTDNDDQRADEPILERGHTFLIRRHATNDRKHLRNDHDATSPISVVMRPAGPRRDRILW